MISGTCEAFTFHGPLPLLSITIFLQTKKENYGFSLEKYYIQWASPNPATVRFGPSVMVFLLMSSASGVKTILYNFRTNNLRNTPDRLRRVRLQVPISTRPENMKSSEKMRPVHLEKVH